jgi:hypothetical protein
VNVSRETTTVIWSDTYASAQLVARGLGVERFTYIKGPDDLRLTSFHLIHNKDLTMGMEYRLSVARASGGQVTTQKVPT